jgi:hypothetical protein
VSWGLVMAPRLSNLKRRDHGRGGLKQPDR